MTTASVILIVVGVALSVIAIVIAASVLWHSRTPTLSGSYTKRCSRCGTTRTTTIQNEDESHKYVFAPGYVGNNLEACRYLGHDWQRE